MPWQRQVLDVALEVDSETGRLVYREVILTVPRQSGKTTLMLVLVLVRALREARQQIRYTAQTGADARKKWMDDWLPILQDSRFRDTFTPRLTNGHEALRFRNGSLQGLVATTKKTGHGGTLDLGILDEAFAHPDSRLEQALRPAMSTRPDPQLWIVSTAGVPGESPYLWGKVETGRALVDADVDQDIAYFEWSAPDDADPGDPDTWRACMPALGITVTEGFIASTFESMREHDLHGFRRAFLNQWVSSVLDPPIPLDLWAELADEGSQPGPSVAFALDVQPDRSHAAIGVAGLRADGKMHVEVVEHRAGTGWVVGRLAQLVERHRPSGVWCDPRSPAGSLLHDLAAAGVGMETVGASEYAQACGAFYDLVVEDRLRHLGGPTLLSALDGAAWRPLGDARAWSRKGSSSDISPLVAVTLAAYGASTPTIDPANNVW